jgi:hypothetical protein
LRGGGHRCAATDRTGTACTPRRQRVERPVPGREQRPTLVTGPPIDE